MTDVPTDPTPRSRTKFAWLIVLLVAILIIGTFSLRGSGLLGKFKRLLGFGPPPRALELVVGTTPPDAATGVDPAAPIAIEFKLPFGPIDPATVTNDSVGLFRVRDRARVEADVTLNGNRLVITPRARLDDNKNYRLHLLPVLKDVKGNPIKEITRSFFTTAMPPAGVAFQKVPLPASELADRDRAMYTCVAVSVDHRLYASTVDGRLFRYAINADGTLGNQEIFETIQSAEKGPRTVTGFAIDPKSDPANPDIFVTHSGFNLSAASGAIDFDNVPDLTGKLSRLSGPNLSKIEDLLTGLPRSARDHAPNQPHFGPDGALYFPQPSNTAVGAADKYWRMRPEHGLSATILRLDVRAMPPGTPPLSTLTKDVGGSFDPAAPGSPLTIYASGLRMPFDLLWHTNGQMYTAVNGASSTGATPPGPNGNPGIEFVGLAEHDWFFKIVKGGYHGHPNPVQGHFVLNGGNPTNKPDFDEVSEYPVGVKPESNWTSASFDFGVHISADGTIEYRSDRFGGALKGKIFVCRFNLGKDLILLGLDADGEVNYAATGIPGTTDLEQPLDLVEDPTNGNLYVCEFGAGRLTLLRPIEGGTPTTAPAATR